MSGRFGLFVSTLPDRDGSPLRDMSREYRIAAAGAMSELIAGKSNDRQARSDLHRPEPRLGRERDLMRVADAVAGPPTVARVTGELEIRLCGNCAQAILDMRGSIVLDASAHAIRIEADIDQQDARQVMSQAKINAGRAAVILAARYSDNSWETTNVFVDGEEVVYKPVSCRCNCIRLAGHNEENLIFDVWIATSHRDHRCVQCPACGTEVTRG